MSLDGDGAGRALDAYARARETVGASRRACRSIRRRPCSSSAGSSPSRRFLEALRARPLGAGPWPSPIYITTAISYPNGRPHIGHAYEAIAADAIARFQRAQGRDVCFLTGTDEHGLKMAQTARAEGRRHRANLPTKCPAISSEMGDDLNISYDRFIRTTEPRHYDASQAIWKAMEASGDLYLDRYEGWYSVRDEAYYDEKELVDGDGGEKLSPQGTPVEWTVEESWFFRLSELSGAAARLIIATIPTSSGPKAAATRCMRFVEGGLTDLSRLAHQLRLGRPGAGQRQTMSCTSGSTR